MQQIIVPEVGPDGQQKIAVAKVLIIGAGGLGTPLALYLSSAGVGTIGILDGDNVTISNLSRQFMYTEKETGKSKAALLASKLSEQNPSIHVIVHSDMLQKGNATHFIKEYDIICDCTDNAESRILTDIVCSEMLKPLVYAVVRGWEGYVTVLHHKRAISLRDIFSYQSLLDNEALNCSVAGIINTTCGIVGSIQASEVIKIILELPSKLDGGILAFNSLDPAFRIFNLK